MDQESWQTPAARKLAPITLDARQAEQLEALASGMLPRSPALADELLAEIARARIVDHDRLPKDVVALGKEVTYRDEKTGQEKTVMLVLPQEADIARGRASVSTPIGVALIGLSEGASFTWKDLGGRTRNLTVVRVSSGA